MCMGAQVSDRVHLLIDEGDKARYRDVATREGKSLSVWLREAAEQRYRATVGERALSSRADLEAFFAECGARERGTEPDWSLHKRVIEESLGDSLGTGARQPSKRKGR